MTIHYMKTCSVPVIKTERQIKANRNIIYYLLFWKNADIEETCGEMGSLHIAGRNTELYEF